ncbi:MAG: AAA family ATPase [Gammaproteobacteria bacterium]
MFLETHLSYIFFNEQYAYKVKKNVKYDFVDFSNLENRRYFCEQELELSRYLAPGLYVGIIPVWDDESGRPLSLLGQGPNSNWAIKMQRFSQQDLFDKLLSDQKLKKENFIDLANKIAVFHLTTMHCPEPKKFANLNLILERALDNLESKYYHYLPEVKNNMIHEIRAWTEKKAKELAWYFDYRRQQGYIKACHGDLHLGNIVLFKGQVLAFDPIEFNDNFRYIDTACEIAFLRMDLEEKNADYLGHCFLNHYLIRTGDYTSLTVLQFYQVYLAMVRAKVRSLAGKYDESEKYLDFAYQKINLDLSETKPRPRLIMMHGVSGSGKSTWAEKISEQHRAIHIRSDEERKRYIELEENLYTPEKTINIYARLEMIANIVLESGYSVIIDAAFLDPNMRQSFYALAKKQKVECLVLSCKASQPELEQRINLRLIEKNDISDADVQVLHQQLAQFKPLSSNEYKQAKIIEIDTQTQDPEAFVL